MFSNGIERRGQDHEIEIRELHAKIGKLTVERDFLSRGAGRRAMVMRDHQALMRRIDELFLKYPFYGARQMVRHLRRAMCSRGVCRTPWMRASASRRSTAVHFQDADYRNQQPPPVWMLRYSRFDLGTRYSREENDRKSQNAERRSDLLRHR